MVQQLVVFLGVLPALSVGFAEDIVGQHSLSEACVAWKGISQLDVVLSVLLNNGVVCPFGVSDLGCFLEGIGLDDGELVDFFPMVFDSRLIYNIFTSFTVILVSGTPTMLAAVLWSRSEGGR